MKYYNIGYSLFSEYAVLWHFLNFPKPHFLPRFILDKVSCILYKGKGLFVFQAMMILADVIFIALEYFFILSMHYRSDINDVLKISWCLGVMNLLTSPPLPTRIRHCPLILRQALLHFTSREACPTSTSTYQLIRCLSYIGLRFDIYFLILFITCIIKRYIFIIGQYHTNKTRR